MNIPKGYKLVPAEMHLDREVIGAINFHCGDGGDNFGEHTHGLLWVGAMNDDEGKEVYGLHLLTAEYPEEGSTTLVEFAAPAPPQPIYDEAKERELFAEWWRNTPILRVNKLQLAEAAWLACAQSRAKAGEVDHE